MDVWHQSASHYIEVRGMHSAGDINGHLRGHIDGFDWVHGGNNVGQRN